MQKRSYVRLEGIARPEPGGASAWQDPGAQLIAERFAGLEGSGIVIMELGRLKRLGIPITVELIDRVIDEHDQREARIAEAKRLHAMAPPRGYRKSKYAEIDMTSQVVYYMRIGNRCKIGTSTNLRGRLETINPEELLVVELGGADKERERHRQFAALRTHGEWFRYEGPLVEHVAALQAAEDAT